MIKINIKIKYNIMGKIKDIVKIYLHKEINMLFIKNLEIITNKLIILKRNLAIVLLDPM